MTRIYSILMEIPFVAFRFLYHPPTKLREGNVFSRAYLSVRRGHCTGPQIQIHCTGVPSPRHFQTCSNWTSLYRNPLPRTCQTCSTWHLLYWTLPFPTGHVQVDVFNLSYEHTVRKASGVSLSVRLDPIEMHCDA